MFNSTPDDLDMHVIYDVSHNIAKVENGSFFSQMDESLRWKSI